MKTTFFTKRLYSIDIYTGDWPWGAGDASDFYRFAAQLGDTSDF